MELYGERDELLEQWFSSEGEKDEDVLDRVKLLRNAGILCYIATRQEKYRMEYLLDTVGLREEFDGVFVTCEIGCDKSDSAFFKHALEELGLTPEQMLFLDDTQKNVDTAAALGIRARFYDGIQVLDEEVEAMLGK